MLILKIKWRVVLLVLLHKPKAKNQVDQWREMILVWLWKWRQWGWWDLRSTWRVLILQIPNQRLINTWQRVVKMSWMRSLIFWLGGRLILHNTMCFQELNDMFLQFQYPLRPQNLHLLRLVVFLIPSSSLSPFVVEALICGQNWLGSSSAPINLQVAMDDVEEFEKLDGDMTIIFYIKKKYECLCLYLLK